MLELNSPVQDFFDSEACRYAEQFLPRKSGRAVIFQTRLALARQLSRGCSGRLLDCATGTGEVAAAIYSSGQFCDATFVDISSEMLRQAQSFLSHFPGQNLHFVQADIFHYLTGLTAGAKFDLIVCLGLIAHTGRLEELLRSVRAHLADGGRILLQTSFADHWGNRLWRLLLDRRATRRHGYAFSYYTQQQIIRAVHQAQFAILAVHRYGVGVPFLEKVAPWANYQFEVSFRSWASRNGAEAIYVLGKRGPEFPLHA
jgi:ubiquinone/menaquinone biosynthesis C-methylase UbiE